MGIDKQDWSDNGEHVLHTTAKVANQKVQVQGNRGNVGSRIKISLPFIRPHSHETYSPVPAKYALHKALFQVRE